MNIEAANLPTPPCQDHSITSTIGHCIDFTTFIEREEAHYCIHAKAALKLSCKDFNVHDIPDIGELEDGEDFVDTLSTTPLLGVAYSGSYGFISQQKQRSQPLFTKKSETLD